MKNKDLFIEGKSITDKYIKEYNYPFEEGMTSFYLEIFSKSTQMKIEDISGGELDCLNYFHDFTKLNSSELIKFDCSKELNKSSKILISFKYSGKMESERHFRFRLLSTNISDNLVYLKESEESICDPKYGDKYCLFFFNLPKNILKGDIVSIYGYYEEIPKNLILFAKQIYIRNELTKRDFDQLKEEYNNNINEKNLDYLELEIIPKYYKLSYNNYIIGLHYGEYKENKKKIFHLI